MSTTLTVLGWPELLVHLAACARTPAGARACLHLDLSADFAEIRSRYAAVEEARALEEAGDSLPVGGVGDIAAWMHRAGRGSVLEIDELRSIGATLDALRLLRRWMAERADEAPLLWSIAVSIEIDDALTDLLRRSFDSAGELSGTEYPVLDELRRRVASLQSHIQSTLDELVKGESLAGVLQDRYYTERDGRYVLPVKASFRRGLGIVHGTSQSGETVYVEPTAVVEAHNDLREAEAALAHESHRILAELTRQLASRRAPILQSLDAALRLDMISARTTLGRKLRGICPSVGTDGVLVAHAARHPLLALSGNVVDNDLALTPERPGLVLTGPNAGGKTVALKTLGLLALMVRAGIPLPCTEGSRVDLFDPIIADIGDQQSVADGLSTFSAHVRGLGRALAAARPGALVLIDEITSGTDPAQGAALARAVMEALVEAGARVAVTTHFPELKTLPVADPRFTVCAAEFAEGRPTFRIQTGIPGPSHALAIARRMGVPEAVLTRATLVMDTNQRDLAERLEKLDAERTRARLLEVELRHRLDALTRRERKHAESEERLRAQGQRLQEEANEKHKARLKKIEEEMRRMVAELQANPDLRSANAALQTVRAARVDAIAAPASPPPPAPKADHAVGDSVRIPRLGQIGRITAIAGDSRVEVEIGRIRTWLGPEEVVPATRKDRRVEAARAAEPPVRDDPPPPPVAADGRRAASLRMDFNTVDLRGMRVDEGIAASEQFFDAQSRLGVLTNFILHGHGTGAMKTGIRAWLPTCRGVRSWRPADADEGGDAYTVVELR